MTTYHSEGSPLEAAVIRNLFLASIFLYPFQILSHTLYLLPQMGFMGVMLWRFLTSRSSVSFGWGLLCVSGLFSVVSAAAVETLADSPSYDLVIKMVVNVITVCIIASRRSIFFGIETATALRRIALTWLVISVAVYAAKGMNFSSILVSMTSGEQLASSELYGFAEPLASVYLTKNITAMFVASTFALFLYVCAGVGRKVTLIDFAVFFLSVLVFFSRQALIAMVVLYVCYKLLSVSRKQALMIVAAGAAILYAFVMAFFNFDSKGDGASERLLLWRYFFDHFSDFYFSGFGVNGLNDVLKQTIGIDNFHMFFMNQIGAYGLVHFIAFSTFCLTCIFSSSSSRYRWVLVAGYYLNVLFQTYGYEYGNLFLLGAAYALTVPKPAARPAGLPHAATA